jgi:hypothetical protein
MRNLGGYLFALGCGYCGVVVACSSHDAGTEGTSSSGGGFVVGAGGGGNVGGSYVSNAGGSANVGGNGTGNVGNSTSCAQQEVPIAVLPPDIMIVMDRSTSMTADMNGQSCTGGCGINSKWYQVKGVIENVVQSTQSSVNWGLFWLGNEAAQCGVGTAPIVPITPGASYTPIQQALEAEAFTGKTGTPTAAVVNNAVTYIQSLTDSNPKYMLVATDGEPNCASGSTGTTDATGAANAAANALRIGIGTFVVGIATTSSATATTALNQMAVAGGYPQQGAATQYYAVADTASLQTALSQIVGLAASCTISLTNTPSGDWTIAITATDASTGNVVQIPEDPANGWEYTDSTRTAIQLNGAACAALKAGTYSNFSFIYTCRGGQIIIA